MDGWEEIRSRESEREKPVDRINWFAAAEMSAIIMGKTDGHRDACGKNRS